MQPILLSDIIPVADPSQFKLHLACASEGYHPLNEYVKDATIWHQWNESPSAKNHWNRPFVFSFIEYYPLPDSWLFGGVFAVRERRANGYSLERVAAYDKFDGRVICHFHRYQGMRGRAFVFEKYAHSFEVSQILPERYSGEAFCGFGKIDHTLGFLRDIVQRNKPDWRAALANVKGVYLIVDTTNGKPYIGSASGDEGIWSRLAGYVLSGHGGNDALVTLLKGKSIDYALANFKFSILELFPFATPDAVIIDREQHWKNVLLSRQFGYNKN